MARTNPSPLKTERWQATRTFVAHRASFRCECCFAYVGMHGEVDHIIPRGTCELLGIGVFDPSNLQLLCPSCHSQKTGRERWHGHEKKPPKAHTRTNVTGREAFLAATGIPETPKRKVQC